MSRKHSKTCSDASSNRAPVTHCTPTTSAQMSQVVDINDKYLIILTVMSEDTEKVVIELNRGTTIAAYRTGDTLLQTARAAGLQPPYSCETGSCGTCMAQL